MSCLWTGKHKNDPRGPKIHDPGPRNAGPAGWKYLHLSALDGELTHQKALEFSNCIECPDCRRHFQKLLREKPVGNDSFGWTVWAHNQVNAQRRVPAMKVEDARRHWSTSTHLVPVGMAAPGVPQMSHVILRPPSVSA